jgi:valyl-tRNA synthetase
MIRSPRKPRRSIGGVLVELDTSGTIDVAAERGRLTKDLSVAEKSSRSATRS